MREVTESFAGCANMDIKVKHNGFCGDKYETVVEIVFNMDDNFNVQVKPVENLTDHLYDKTFSLIFTGDSERQSLVESLKMVLKELESNKIVGHPCEKKV